MNKIMYAEEWLRYKYNTDDLDINPPIRPDESDMEEYHEYRKSVELCRNCKHWLCKKPTDTYAICTEWSPEDKRENWTCHQWQEKENG